MSSLGTLSITLSAETTAFMQGMAGVAKSVEQTAAHLRKLSGATTMATGALMAMGGALATEAAKWSPAVAGAMGAIKQSYASVAVEVGQMLVPALTQVAKWLKTVADYVAGMTPAQKEMVSTVAKWVVGLGAASVALGVLLPLLQALAAVAGVAMTALAAIGLPGLLALGALAVGVAVLRKAWTENWGGMQGVVKTTLENLAGFWTDFKGWLFSLWDGFIDKWASIEKAIQRTLNLQATVTPGSGHFGDFGNLEKRNKQSDARIEQWAGAAQGGAVTAALKLGATKVAEGAGEIVNQWKGLGRDVKEVVLGWLGDFRKGSSAAIGKMGPSSGGVSGMDIIADLSIAASEAAAAAAEDLAQSQRDAAAANEDAIMAMISFSLEAQRAATAAGQVGSELQAAAEEAARAAAQRAALPGVVANAAGGVVGAMQNQKYSLGSVVQGAQSGSAAGPWGMIIGAVVAVVLQLEAFQKVIGSVMAYFGKLMDGWSKDLEPLFDGIISIAEAFTELQMITLEMSGGMAIVKGAFKIIGIVMTAVSVAMFELAKGFYSILGKNTAEIQKQIDAANAKLREFDLFKDTTKAIETATPPIQKMGEAAQDVADKFGEMLVNMPSGYKLRGAQFRADDGGGGSSGGGGGAYDFSGLGFNAGNLLPNGVGSQDEWSTAAFADGMAGLAALAGGPWIDTTQIGGTEGMGGGGPSAAEAEEIGRLVKAYLDAFMAALAAGLSEAAAAEAAAKAQDEARRSGTLRDLAKAIANQSATELKRSYRNGATKTRVP